MPDPLLEARAFLAGLDPDWARHVEAVGPCLHQAKPAREPCEALVRAIAYQQLHARAGDAILGRFLGLYGQGTFPSPNKSSPPISSSCVPAVFPPARSPPFVVLPKRP